MIGIDIASVGRFEKIFNRFGISFLKRFLNDDEIYLCVNGDIINFERIAGFWATKEALSKALGVGIGTILKFHNIHIYKLDNGMPCVKIEGIREFEGRNISLSISHDGGFAIAVVFVGGLNA